MTVEPYRLVRVFPVAGTDEERLLSKTYELRLPPRRGHDLVIPGVGVRRVARITQTAREASPTWEPAYRTGELVAVELEPEPATQYEIALAAGWKAV